MKCLILFVLSLISLNLYSQNILVEFLTHKADSTKTQSIKLMYLGGRQYAEGDFLEGEVNLKKSIEAGLDVSYRNKAELALGLLYIEKKDFDSALNVLRTSASYEYGYYYEAVRLIAMYKMGDDIELELNDLLNSWEAGHYDDYYLICDFLLKIEKPELAHIFIENYEKIQNEFNVKSKYPVYMLYVKMNYLVGDYGKSLKYLEEIKEEKSAKSYYGFSHYKYWETIIKFNLGDIGGAKNSLIEGLKNEDYHNRFSVLMPWYFSDEQIMIMERLEVDIDK